ncbi:unnamed protein product [Pedinophyceae sp. YPF-701]|nr:unnamed protein product [Pedinophyceae sp. YPF-701]
MRSDDPLEENLYLTGGANQSVVDPQREREAVDDFRTNLVRGAATARTVGQSGVSYDAAPQHVSDDRSGYDARNLPGDDDLERLALSIDVRQYRPRRRICGIDCTALLDRLAPPDWWYSLSYRQRNIAKAFVWGGAALLVLVLVISTSAQWARTAKANETCRWTKYRLPTAVRPTRQEVSLTLPEIKPGAEVTGTTSIYVEVEAQEPTRRAEVAAGWAATAVGTFGRRLAGRGLRASEDGGVNCIIMHAAGMDVRSAEVVVVDADGAAQGEAQRANFAMGGESEQLSLHVADAVPGGSRARIDISFAYRLQPGLRGLYLSQYDAGGESDDEDEGVSYLATTQMQTTDARRAFPCFDEPALKAVFQLTVDAPAGLTALSNTPEGTLPAGTAPPEGLERHAFQPTPPMSSYLVALVVGSLVHTSVDAESSYDPKLPIRVFGVEGRDPASLEAAARFASKIVPAYEGLFGSKFKLPKLDLVAVPDFAAGAMENWGLVTYRETDLLVSTETSSRGVRRVAVVVAHELAHMWFGDLVTTRWWNDIWLNEGFASYFEHVGADAANAEYAHLPSLFVDTARGALHADGLASSHALAPPPEDVDSKLAVESMFDTISYRKGASFLHMLRWMVVREGLNPVGEDQLVTALRSYLQAHELSSVTTRGSFVPAVARVVGDGDEEAGKETLDSWLYRQGYPLVLVTMVRDEDPSIDGHVRVEQLPFLEGAGTGTCSDAEPAADRGVAANEGRWLVPLEMRRGRDPDHVKWYALDRCKPAHHVVEVAPENDEEYLLVNAGHRGFYRVAYDASLWGRLVAAARTRPTVDSAWGLTEQDIAGLLDDAWALSRAGMQPISHFLGLVRAVGARTGPLEYSTWATIPGYLTELGWYSEVMGKRGCDAELATWAKEKLYRPLRLAHPGIGSLQADPETLPPATRLVRARMLLHLGLLGDDEVGREAFDLLKMRADVVLQEDGRTPQPGSEGWIHPDTRDVTYEVAMLRDGTKSFDLVKGLHKAARDPAEVERALMALASSRNGDLARAAIDYALSEHVRAQDKLRVLTRVAYSSHENAQWTWKAIRNRWGEIAAQVGGTGAAAGRMGRLVSTVAGRLAERDAIEIARELRSAHPEEISESDFKKAQEAVESNMAWVERNGQSMCEWVRAHAS